MNTITIVPTRTYNQAYTGYHLCLLSIFKRARLDCEKASRKHAVDALCFLCSDRAETLSQYLNITTDDLTGLTRRCWQQVRERFGLTLDDLDRPD